MMGLPDITRIITPTDRVIHFLSLLLMACWMAGSVYAIANCDKNLFRDTAAFGIAGAVLYWLMRRSIQSRFREQSHLNQMFCVAHTLDMGFVGKEAVDEASKQLTEQRLTFGAIEGQSSRDQLIEAAAIVVLNLQWGFGDRLLSLGFFSC